ncbi:S9 family peptidase [Streptacidiphilus melanogenes]|uniref:S9 family peptidase n=1 Tax=Streptacidiphilus melanogenes TaxID=411235 RepID=UPI00069326F0|nr:prolyl oligopeptidase family serine peptidase [Streptacidiphilus melanogenes]
MTEFTASAGTVSGTRSGAWASPITPEAVGAQEGTPTWPSVVGAETWWCSSDPTASRVRLLRCAGPGTPAQEVLGAAWSVGNRSLGYGGRPFLVLPGEARHRLVFTHAADQRLYLVDVAASRGPADAPTPVPVPLTPADPDGVTTAYADPILGADPTEVWCVREVTRAASGAGLQDPAPRTSRDIVAVPLSGAAADDPGAIRVVARSHHFLSGIRLSPDASRLAWIGWNHPDMPWDTSDLMVARIRDGVAVRPRRVLGGEGVSVPQAEWADARSLYAMADPDGWWNLHRVELAGESARASCVLRVDAECSHAIWRVGATSFAVTEAGVVLRQSRGEETLQLWDPATGTVTDLAPEWTSFALGHSTVGHSTVQQGAGGQGVGGQGAAGHGAVAVVAAGPTETAHPVRFDLASVRGAHTPVVTVSRHTTTTTTTTTRGDRLGPWHSVPERRTVPVPGGWEVPYLYYPPTNPDHPGRRDGAAPLLIDVHGGPTNRTGGTRSLEISLFTSRGYAVASVDYGGSTGYGRAYRDRLRHHWGRVDVDDSVAVTRALAEAGLADPLRTAIRGGSAGGWTALAALAHTDVFCCGSVYPISDPLTWSGGQTHDFESRYVETLVGVLPDDEDRHRAVSPLANAARITVPFVMLQGLDDTICRPDQARRLVEAVDRAHGPGLCFRHLEFPGEGHGFRRAATVAAALRAELELYAQVMHGS